MLNLRNVEAQAAPLWQPHYSGTYHFSSQEEATGTVPKIYLKKNQTIGLKYLGNVLPVLT